MTFYQGEDKLNPIFVASYNDMINYINNVFEDQAYRTALGQPGVPKQPTLTTFEPNLTVHVLLPDSFQDWLENGGGQKFLENSGLTVDDIYDEYRDTYGSIQEPYFSTIQMWKAVSYNQYKEKGTISQQQTYFCIAVPILNASSIFVQQGQYNIPPGETRNPLIYSIYYDPDKSDELIIDSEYFYLNSDDVRNTQAFVVKYQIDGQEVQQNLDIIERIVSFAASPPSPSVNPFQRDLPINDNIIDRSGVVSAADRNVVIPSVTPQREDFVDARGFAGSPDDINAAAGTVANVVPADSTRLATNLSNTTQAVVANNVSFNAAANNVSSNVASANLRGF